MGKRRGTRRGARHPAYYGFVSGGRHQHMNDCMVRAALSGDMQEVFAIRNHPATRVFSSNQDELAWDAHVAWFTRQYLIPSPHRCYVLDCDDRVVGYCRFDARDDGGYAVSIA